MIQICNVCLLKDASMPMCTLQVDTGDPTEIYQILDAQNNLTVNQRFVLNIVYCLTGCDTTCPFPLARERKQHVKLLKRMKNYEIQDLLVFNDMNASHEGIQATGEHFFLKLCGCPTNSTLNKHHYLRYNQCIAKLRLTSTFKARIITTNIRSCCPT